MTPRKVSLRLRLRPRLIAREIAAKKGSHAICPAHCSSGAGLQPSAHRSRRAEAAALFTFSGHTNAPPEVARGSSRWGGGRHWQLMRSFRPPHR